MRLRPGQCHIRFLLSHPTMHYKLSKAARDTTSGCTVDADMVEPSMADPKGGADLQPFISLLIGLQLCWYDTMHGSHIWSCLPTFGFCWFLPYYWNLGDLERGLVEQTCSSMENVTFYSLQSAVFDAQQVILYPDDRASNFINYLHLQTQWDLIVTDLSCPYRYIGIALW